MPNKKVASVLLEHRLRSELKAKGIVIDPELERAIAKHMYVRMMEHKEIVNKIDNHSLKSDDLDFYITSAVTQIIGDAYNHHMLKESSDLNEFKDRFDRDIPRMIRCIKKKNQKMQRQEQSEVINSIVHKAGNIAKKVLSKIRNK